MKISKNIPPIYNKLKKHFGVKWDDGIAIAYGDTVYSKYPVSVEIRVHEAVHLEQQKDLGVERWWELYLENKNFRLTQEIAAYTEQIRYCLLNMAPSKAVYHVRKLIEDLSGPMYGNMITFEQADMLTYDLLTLKDKHE